MVNLRTIKDGFSGTDDRHIGQYIVVGKKSHLCRVEEKVDQPQCMDCGAQTYRELIIF